MKTYTYFILLFLTPFFSFSQEKIFSVENVHFDLPNDRLYGHADLRMKAVCGGEPRIMVAVDKVVISGFTPPGGVSNEQNKQYEYDFPMEAISGSLYLQGALPMRIPGTNTTFNYHVSKTNISINLQGFLDWIVMEDEKFKNMSCGEWKSYFADNFTGNGSYLNVVEESCLSISRKESCLYNNLVNAHQKIEDAMEKLDHYSQKHRDLSDSATSSDFEALLASVNSYNWPTEWREEDELENLRYTLRRSIDESRKEEGKDEAELADMESSTLSSSSLTMEDHDEEENEEEEETGEAEEITASNDSYDEIVMQLNLKRAELRRKAENAEARGNYGEALNHYQELRGLTRNNIVRNSLDKKMNVLRVGYGTKKLLYGIIDQFLVSDEDPYAPWRKHKQKEQAIIDKYYKKWMASETSVNYYNFIVNDLLQKKVPDVAAFAQDREYRIENSLLKDNVYSLDNLIKDESKLKSADSIYTFSFYYKNSGSADSFLSSANRIAEKNLPGASFEIFENRIINLGGPQMGVGTSEIMAFTKESLLDYAKENEGQIEEDLIEMVSPGFYNLYNAPELGANWLGGNYYMFSSTDKQELEELKLHLNQHYENGIKKVFMVYSPEYFDIVKIDYQFFREIVENTRWNLSGMDGMTESFADYLFFPEKKEEILAIIEYFLKQGYDATEMEYGESLLTIAFEAEDGGELLRTIFENGVDKEYIQYVINETDLLEYGDYSKSQVEDWLKEYWKPAQEHRSFGNRNVSNNPINRTNIGEFSSALSATNLEKREFNKILRKNDLRPSVEKSWALDSTNNHRFITTDEDFGEALWVDNGRIFRRIEVLNHSWGMNLPENQDYILNGIVKCEGLESTESDAIGGFFLAAEDSSMDSPSGIAIQVQGCPSLKYKPSFNLVFFRSGKRVKKTGNVVTNAIIPGKDNRIQFRSLDNRYELFINGEKVWSKKVRKMPSMTRLHYFGQDKSFYSYDDLSLLAFVDESKDIHFEDTHYIYDPEQNKINVYHSDGSLRNSYDYDYDRKRVIDADFKIYLDKDQMMTYDKTKAENVMVYKINEEGEMYPTIFYYDMKNNLLWARDYRTSDFLRRHGYTTEYYPDGALKNKRQYFDGKLYNYEEAYLKSGTRLNTGDFSDGNGTVFFFNFEKGEKASEMTFKNGKIIRSRDFEDKYMYYINEDGEYIYKKFYDSSLEKVESVKTNKGFRYQLEEYDENGNLVNIKYERF